jgi:hypothetical protein
MFPGAPESSPLTPQPLLPGQRQCSRQFAGILHAICNHFAGKGKKSRAAVGPGPVPNALTVELDGPHLSSAVNL